MASKLLQSPPQSLQQAFTVRQIKATTRAARYVGTSQTPSILSMNALRSVYSVPLTPAQAAENRDSLVKALYELLFQWLVNRINLVLDHDDEETSMETLPFIGILDIFGFEIFEKNRFDQLCINYCNERLQQYFNKHIFQIEQQECMAEGVQLSLINFSDNTITVKLIDEDRVGLLAQLQEESLLPKGTDLTLLSKLQSSLQKNASWKKLDPRRAQVNYFFFFFSTLFADNYLFFILKRTSFASSTLRARSRTTSTASSSATRERSTPTCSI